MKVIIILLINISFILNLNAQVKQRIAVLNLESVGVSKTESVTLTDRLRSELVKTGSFTIIERSEMDDILQEQGFQLTGCTTDECVVEAGKLLNVSHICAGSIGKVGALYTVSVRLIDVETGEILKIVTEDSHGSIENVLTSSMRNVALKLSGRIASGGVLTEGSGDIYLKTEPPGAEIYLDNVNTGKTSPASLRNVAAGQHLIKVVKGNFIGTKSVTIKANDIVQETVGPEKARGGIKIYSDPPEAEIIIDGESNGKTPKIVRELPVGDHLLVLKMAGYEEYRKTVQVNFNQLVNIDGKLQRLADLNIKSNPSDVEIYIDGKYYGRTPKLLKSFSGGSYNLSLKKKGYTDYKQEIKIVSGKTFSIKGNLEKQIGTVKFTSYQPGALIKMNGKTYRLSKKEINLPTGDYSFEISQPGYESKNFDIIVEYNKTNNLNVALQRKTKGKAFTRSLFLPGWGQAYQGKTTRAWIYPIAFVGSGAGAIYCTMQYNTAVTDYNEIRNQYLSAVDENEINRLRGEMDAKYDEVNSLETTRNIFYVTTAAIWLWNVLDTVILPAAWEKIVSFSAQNDNEKVWAGVVVKL
jgi:TolB-like protein